MMSGICSFFYFLRCFHVYLQDFKIFCFVLTGLFCMYANSMHLILCQSIRRRTTWNVSKRRSTMNVVPFDACAGTPGLLVPGCSFLLSTSHPKTHFPSNCYRNLSHSFRGLANCSWFSAVGRWHLLCKPGMLSCTTSLCVYRIGECESYIATLVLPIIRENLRDYGPLCFHKSSPQKLHKFCQPVLKTIFYRQILIPH